MIEEKPLDQVRTELREVVDIGYNIHTVNDLAGIYQNSVEKLMLEQ